MSIVPCLVCGLVRVVTLASAEGTLSGSYLLRCFVATTLFGGLVIGAVVAVAFIAPSAAVAFLVLLALTAPPVRHLVALPPGRGGPRPERSIHDPQLAARPVSSAVRTGPTVGTMSDIELCLAWRRSFPTLQNARSVEERLSVVALRQAYLDEIESRDATALRAWLDAGARAAGGWERYLAGERRRPDTA